MEATNCPEFEIVVTGPIVTKCQFCFAFYNDPAKTAAHIAKCNFRFSEAFIAFDNRIKFACTVSLDLQAAQAHQPNGKK